MNNYRFTGPVHLKSGLLLSNGFIRVVHGGRGDYVEISSEQICLDVLCLPCPRVEQLHYYFVEHRVARDMKVVVYEQLHEVDYADYKIGMYYISPIYLRDFEIYGRRNERQD